MDAIDEALATGIIDNNILSEPIRHALSIGKKTLNKYYALTDNSTIYRMAMSTSRFLFLVEYVLTRMIVLHPSFKLEYFRKAGWSDEWIAEAVTVTREHWERRYKPSEPTAVDSAMVCDFFLIKFFIDC